ncbi:Putative fluoride ion transporter CrcB [Pseudoclavibacter triregionum]|nr:Putative fluoride ion transporter CrcB [Pseudoclavibacter triregionum]
MRPDARLLLAVFLGGALGTLARFGIGQLAPGAPLEGTLAITTGCNLLGCLLLGAITGLPPTSPRFDALRLGAGTGFCGGFTTLSYVASAEAALLTADPGSRAAWALLVIGVILGVGFAQLGAQLGAWAGRRFQIGVHR